MKYFTKAFLLELGLCFESLQWRLAVWLLLDASSSLFKGFIITVFWMVILYSYGRLLLVFNSNTTHTQVNNNKKYTSIKTSEAKWFF